MRATEFIVEGVNGLRANEYMSGGHSCRSEDVASVAEWLDTSVDNLWVEIKYAPPSYYPEILSQIQEMYESYDEYPDDADRSYSLANLIQNGQFSEPVYVYKYDKSRFVMEGRHRMVAYWLAKSTLMPVAFVSRII